MIFVFERIFFLISELGANGVWNHLDKCTSDPSTETKTYSNTPMNSMKSRIGDLHGTSSELDNDSLSSEASNKDDEEDPVVPHSFEDVQLIVDFSGIDKVEDLHDCEHVEDISHVSAHSVLLFELAVEGGAIPVLESSWEHIGLVAAKSVLDLWLRVEVLASENDRVNDNDLVDGHSE